MTRADVRAVLFDLDGTLIDTAPDMIAALNALRAEESLPPLPYELARTQVSHGSSGLVRLAFPAVEGSPFEQLRERFLAIYNERVAHETKLFDGAVEVLEALEASARPWGIVTNKPTFLTTPLLEAIGIGLRAGCVVAGDTLPQRKPHPAPLLHAATQLRIDPARCVYVGDDLRDVQAGNAAGMATIVASYGYIGAAGDAAAWPATGWIATPGELLAWLRPLARS